MPSDLPRPIVETDPEPLSKPDGFRRPPYRAAWPWVLGVVGLDYLSSLAYQPSVAFAAAGPLAPLATVVVVLVTLLLAVPLYCYLAGRSPHGSGTTGLLERIIPGWFGKLLILVLLGFAATDLIFTRTFSAADAAEHMVRSPYEPWQNAVQGTCDQCAIWAEQLPDEVAPHAHTLNNRQMVVTLLLLVIGSAVAWLFRGGITRWLVRVAVVTLTTYLVLTGIVIVSGVRHLLNHPELFDAWWKVIEDGWQPVGGRQSILDWWLLVLVCVALFPKLALGLSGYELSITSMPLVRGSVTDTPANPRGRIRNTRLLLIVAALLMAVGLLSSTLVVTILVPPSAVGSDGPAANRALSYLAHAQPLSIGGTAADINPLFGPSFGAAYDFAAVCVLTLAGVTVMIGMRDLIPPYLYRLGMDWKWSQRVGMLTYLFTFLKLAVTYVYGADPDAQRSAYLTGVLSLFTAAAATALVDVWQRRRGCWILFRVSPIFLAATVLFGMAALTVVRNQPSGLKMALWFIGATLLVSMVTRFFRNHELRHRGFEFADANSKYIWEELLRNDYRVIVPVRPDGPSMAEKERDMRDYHRIPADMPVVFIKAEPGDGSDFWQLPVIAMMREEGRVVAHISRCSSVAHAIAAAALDIAKQGEVPEVHFGWSGEHPLTANLHFVLFGQGNVPWMVYELIQAADAPADRKPRVMVG